MFLRLWGESYLKTMKDENNIKIRAVQWPFNGRLEETSEDESATRSFTVF